MTSTRGHLLVLGVHPFAEVRCTGFADGDCLWDLSLRQRTGDGQDWWRDVFGEVVDFLLWGSGGGEEELQDAQCRDDVTMFRRTMRIPNSPVCMYILYVGQWKFRFNMSSGHHEGGPRSSIALDRHVCCSTSTTRRPSPHIEDGEGVVVPRSATDSTEQWVWFLYTCGLCCYVLYVYYMYMSVIFCYILYVCEMLCVCYVSSSSGLLYLYMSVLCCYMLYVSYVLYV